MVNVLHHGYSSKLIPNTTNANAASGDNNTASSKNYHPKGFWEAPPTLPGCELPRFAPWTQPSTRMPTIFEKTPVHSENCWEGCPTNHRQSSKARRRIPSHLPSLLIILYGLLKMSSGSTVPDPDPELINTQNFDFAKPKLFFKNIAKYAATSTYQNSLQLHYRFQHQPSHRWSLQSTSGTA